MSASSSLRRTLWPTPNLMGAIVSPFPGRYFRHIAADREAAQTAFGPRQACCWLALFCGDLRQKSPGQCRGLVCRKVRKIRSVARDHRPTPTIIYANTNDVVGKLGSEGRCKGRRCDSIEAL